MNITAQKTRMMGLSKSNGEDCGILAGFI